MVHWEILPKLTAYKQSLEMMENHVQNMIDGKAHEKVILLEHEDVYTSGTGEDGSGLINAGNIPIFETGRGGKFTYHGPGQRVIYPMLNLGMEGREKDLRKYIKTLERWIILALQEFDIDSFIVPDRVGIWVLQNGYEKKIGAIGVRVKRWITYHGIAININTDLGKFSGIIPCGLKDFGVTSIHELGKKVSFEEFDIALRKHFEQLF